MGIENYTTIDEGEIYLSSLSDYGRDTKTILTNFIDESSKKANHVSMIYRKVLESLILRFGRLNYISSEQEIIEVKTFHANPERAIAKLNQDDNIVLPIATISNTGSDTDENRVRYKGVLIHTKYRNPITGIAYRIVSLAPRPINISYEVNIWAKYISDLDQLTEQIRREFNPHINISTSLSKNNKAFLEGQTNTSELSTGDGEDRVIRRTFNITVETYVPYPEYLLTANSKIQLFTTQLYNIINGPIDKPSDFTTATTNPAAGEFPSDTVVAVAEPELVFEANSITPDYGPYSQEVSIEILGEGLFNDTLITLDGKSATSVFTGYEGTKIVATFAAFDESDNGNLISIQLVKPGYALSDATINLSKVYRISPVPDMVSTSAIIVEGNSLSNSGLEFHSVGNNFNNYLQPYYSYDSGKVVLYANGLPMVTDIVTNNSVSGYLEMSNVFSNVEVDVILSGLNGSSGEFGAITLPGLDSVTPQTLVIDSVTPAYGPYGYGNTIEITGAGYNNISQTSALIGGALMTNVSISPVASGMTIKTPIVSENLAGLTIDIVVSSTDNGNQTDTLSGGYTISPEPTVSSVNVVTTNEVAAVTVSGADLSGYMVGYGTLTNRTRIVINGVHYDTDILSDTQVSCSIPITTTLQGNTYDVTLSSLNGATTSSSGITFESIASNTTEVGYIDPSSIANPLVSVTVPIEHSSTEPTFYMDGSACDVFPVAWTADNKIDVVQVVGPVSGGGTATLSNIGSVVAPSAGQFSTLELSGVTLEVDVVGKASNMTSQLTNTSKEVIRNGVFINEEHFHSLITDSTKASTSIDYSIGNVQSFITRRSDTSGIELWMLIANDNFDINKDSSKGVKDGSVDYHTEISGEVWFKSMQLTGLPAGYKLYAEFEDPSMDSDNGYIIRPVNNSGDTFEQLLANRQRIIRHYVIGPNNAAGLAEATSLLEMDTYGQTISGVNTYYELPGYGAQAEYHPEITSDFKLKKSHPVGEAYEGLETNDYRCSTTYTHVLDNAVSGTIDTGYGWHREWNNDTDSRGNLNMAQGYYHPYDHIKPGASGGKLIQCAQGWQNNRWLWRTHQLQMTYITQRHDSSITSLQGDIVNASALAYANADSTGTELFSPWSLVIGVAQMNYWFPWWCIQNAPGAQKSGISGREMSPEDRVWNLPTDASASMYGYGPVYSQAGDHERDIDLVRNFWKSGDITFNPYEGMHTVRFLQTFKPLIYSCNLGIAKHIIRQEAAHSEHVHSKYIVKNTHYTDIIKPGKVLNGPDDYMSYNFSFKRMKQYIDDNHSTTYQWGRQKGDKFPSFNRQIGHPIWSISEGYRITDPSTDRRADLFEWADVFKDFFDAYVSNFGSGGGRDQNMNSGNFGQTSIVNASGDMPDFTLSSNDDPLEHEGQTGFEPANMGTISLFMNGLTAVVNSFYGFGSPEAKGIFYRSMVLYPYFIWKYADDIGNEYAQAFIGQSDNLDGYKNPPPLMPVGWDFRSGFVDGWWAADMRCGPFLYAGYIMTGDIKFVEWYYKLMTEDFLEDGIVGNSSLIGVGQTPITDGWERPVNYISALKLFNQIAGAEASSSLELSRTWASYMAPFVALLKHKGSITLPVPNVPTSYYAGSLTNQT